MSIYLGDVWSWSLLRVYTSIVETKSNDLLFISPKENIIILLEMGWFTESNCIWFHLLKFCFLYLEKNSHDLLGLGYSKCNARSTCTSATKKKEIEREKKKILRYFGWVGQNEFLLCAFVTLTVCNSLTNSACLSLYTTKLGN